MGRIRYPIVPIIMFHMITDQATKTPLPWLGLSAALFEECLKYLMQEGYTTLTLQQLYDYLDKGAPIPMKSVVLTFDDGYLDNWVNAYPLLKKYNMHAVIWVSSDAVLKSPIARPTLEDTWLGHVAYADLDSLGYLSEGEIRAMANSGTFEIGAHGKTHTRAFRSSTIIDFQHPGANYYWLTWEYHPECRLSWLSDTKSHSLPLGLPIYEHGWATSSRKYFPDSRLNEHIINFAKKSGGESFFQNRNWKSFLLREVETWRTENQDNGRFETDEELRERLWLELTHPKQYLEELLQRPVDFFCWPGGGSSQLGLNLAQEAGYLATTVRSLPNQFGKHPRMFTRVGMSHRSFPLFEKQLNRAFFVYLIKRTQKMFPYYHLWRVKRFVRRKPSHVVDLRSKEF